MTPCLSVQADDNCTMGLAQLKSIQEETIRLLMVGVVHVLNTASTASVAGHTSRDRINFGFLAKWPC